MLEELQPPADMLRELHEPQDGNDGGEFADQAPPDDVLHDRLHFYIMGVIILGRLFLVRARRPATPDGFPEPQSALPGLTIVLHVRSVRRDAEVFVCLFRSLIRTSAADVYHRRWKLNKERTKRKEGAQQLCYVVKLRAGTSAAR